jgi:hypothetical protein
MTSLKTSGDPKSSGIQASSLSCTSLDTLSFSDGEAFVATYRSLLVAVTHIFLSVVLMVTSMES